MRRNSLVKGFLDIKTENWVLIACFYALNIRIRKKQSNLWGVLFATLFLIS